MLDKHESNPKYRKKKKNTKTIIPQQRSQKLRTLINSKEEWLEKQYKDIEKLFKIEKTRLS